MASMDAPAGRTAGRRTAAHAGPLCAVGFVASAAALRNGIDRVGLTNGAAGPGQRPTIGAPPVVNAERTVLQTYCPSKVDDFEDQVRHLKFDDVARS